jgi:hypothetical protein
MASTAIDATKYTLLNVARHFDPQGKIANIAEVLSQPNDLISDIPWVAGNLPTGHQTTIRTSLPAGTFREVNAGVAMEVETTKSQVDCFASLESYSEIDEITMKLNGNESDFRWQKDLAFVEGLGQTFAKNVFYGNSGVAVTHTGEASSTTYTVNPLGINGLAQKYTGKTGSVTLANTIDADPDSSDATCNSIYLVCWSPNKVYGIYPKAQPAGLQVEDLGKQTVIDYANLTGQAYTSAASAKTYHEAYRTHFKWGCGLCVEDWRYIVRIFNCNLTTKTAAAANWVVTDLMNQALDKLPVGALNSGNAVFYMNGAMKSVLRVEASNKSNVWYQPPQVGGTGPVMMFQEVPIHRCDLLASTEAIIDA